MEKAKKRRSLNIYEIVVFAMLGTLMFCSKIIMEIVPNVHLLGMFTMVFTIVYRVKALLPLYVYVIINGVYAGFELWWFPYLYIWTILWGMTMLLPKRMPRILCQIVYPLVCGLHGFAFGILYAPAQAIMYGLSFEQMRLWILAGIPFDITHCIGDLAAGMLVLPLSELLKKLSKSQYHR